MSRHEALRRWQGRQIMDDFLARGILIRSPSARGVAEEGPCAYKDVGAVVRAAEAGRPRSPRRRLRPVICIKGQVADSPGERPAPVAGFDPDPEPRAFPV